MRALLLFLALLIALPATAISAELKIATWNIEWLTLRPAGDRALPRNVVPKDGASRALLRRYAEELAADVVALQEVDGPDAAATVFPTPRYALHFTLDRVVQRTGFAVRQGLRFTANPDLVSLNVTPDAPNPLRSGADITLELPGGSKLRLLSLHLKSGCKEDRLGSTARPQCAPLRLQLAALQGWITQRRAEGVPFLLLGDFNRWMQPREEFWQGLEQAAPLLRATAGMASPCWGGGGFIDHIIAGGAARGWMVPNSLRVTVFREQGAEWRARLSDHCPIAVRLAIPE
jgi:endonuclease/exonuclease/phosphatase family metal-dependent hydrolase